MTSSFDMTRRTLLAAAPAATAVPFVAALPSGAAAAMNPGSVSYRTVTVDGIDIFYREAGPKGAPAVLLLHGFPSSSHMFRDLIPQLATRFRVIAPDYPGFGFSASPSTEVFPYTFATIADLVDKFTDTVGLGSYTVFMQDYGGPVGFRLAMKNPDRVRGFIVQNAVMSVDGWQPDVVAQLSPFWKERTAETEKPLRAMLTPEGTRFQYEHGSTRPERLSPDAWTHDIAGLSRPGNADLQVLMLWNYQDNVAEYPKWQALLKERQPPILITWGKSDPFFTEKGLAYFSELVPTAEAHVYEAGHFALETHGEEIADLSLAFLDRLAKAN
ncbi:Haloalkane dehalogenase [Hartmannibacter diazotrophicus]|uniref:Haloalkane dehalogenase n=1 Tax=Hartmannibacter diazotrophicus TaxID=1482074 RepID=A0A2C9D530_9HYPH|nr:alpha/beta hydrolase [Hartmannibacter diazotrophicus]SON55396.1 Haloalkane dehalogenase [Hartmannibacter diazotrophicus]